MQSSDPNIEALTAHEGAGHHPGFIRRYIFSTDHKVIGIQFLLTGLTLFVLGGALAMLIRWQLAWPYDLPAGHLFPKAVTKAATVDSPGPLAKKAGLREGDLILSVNGRQIPNTELLGKVLSRRQPGEKGTISFRRGEAVESVKVQFGHNNQFGILTRDAELGAVVTTAKQTSYTMDGGYYAMLLTMHGSVMIFFVIIPLLNGAFGNFLIPLQIGARDMAFPVLNMLSYWLVWPSLIIMMIGFFVEGGHAAAGWTAYPALSSLLFSPGFGQTCWLTSLLILGFSSIMGAVNYLTTILRLRAPGMTMFRLPLSTWALFITAILTCLGTPVLASALLMLLLDRTLGMTFFTPSGHGQVLLWQHLFWFYSHPAVYIMILPGMGMVSDIISACARKPIFGYKPMVYAIAAIAGLGFIVWGHHMFQSGMNPALGMTFMISTMMIALPSAIKTFNWLATLWRSNMRLTPAMLNALAFVSMFVIGGLSGIFMASTPVDIYIHDTYFIVGHIHYVLFGGSMFAIFAAVQYWFPKMFGRMMSRPLGVVHFVLTFIFFNCTFFPMHIIGMAGFPRRIAVGWDKVAEVGYHYLRDVQYLNEFMTHSAFALGAVQVLFALNFIYSLFAGKRAEANPWQANTLEWCAAPSPPPHGNFGPQLPTVYRGAYEYASPLVAEDYLPQTRMVET